MSRKPKPIDPKSSKALAFLKVQRGRRAERRAYQLRRWREYEDSDMMGMLGISLLIGAVLLLGYVRLNGSLF